MKDKKEIVRKLIDEQFKICGHNLKYDDVTHDKIPNWYSVYTCTEEQNQRWIKWGADLIKKELKYTDENARVEMAWVNLAFGLRVV